MQAWLKKKPANVEFIHQPAVFSDVWGKHAKAYYTAEALGLNDKLHADFFDAIQNKKQNKIISMLGENYHLENIYKQNYLN